MTTRDSWRASGRTRASCLSVFLTLVAFFVLPKLSFSQDREFANCDPTQGSVDIDRCPEIRQELERNEIAAQDPCNRGGALDFTECARRAYEKADAELNRVYRDLIAILPDGEGVDGLTKTKLREEERKWVRWKESYCAAIGEKTGGVQMWKSAYTVECWARVTEDQTRKLKGMLKKARDAGLSTKK